MKKPNWQQHIMGARKRAYDDYLRSEEWASIRSSIRVRCNGACEHCGGAMDDVHHLTYEHVGDEPLEDLQGLCRDCHETAHRKNPIPYHELVEEDRLEMQEDISAMAASMGLF